MAKSRPAPAARAPGPPPDRASLHEAALRHLSRFSATEAGLLRVLDRRILRWQHASEAAAEQVAPARAAARAVVAALVAAGMINDAAFAEARARRLVRAGRSRRAVSAHLAAKGIGSETAGTALPDADAEFGAAVALARRRRLGPFQPPEAESADPARTLAVFARAGFPRDVAERVLKLEPDEAARVLAELKRG